jgi:release factor glutamine methyltransferase
MLLSELLTRGSELLRRAGIESAETDAQLLAAHVLGISRGELQSKLFTDDDISSDVAETITNLFQKRSERIPLQHLTGIAYFRNLELFVGPGVFVPRPETEVVAQFAISELMKVSNEPIAVDLCTGSGAIAISIATEVPSSKVYAWELNPDSEPWLRKNIRGNVELVMADIAVDHKLFAELEGLVDVVISNPPYIPTDAVPRDPEVRLHDPSLALYGGEDGMEIMRVVSRRALELLKPGGLFVVEHADNQAQIVADLFKADGWKEIESHQDLSSRDRAVTARKAV